MHRCTPLISVNIILVSQKTRLTADEDEGVSYECCPTEFGDVPDHRKGQKDDQLREDEPASLDKCLAIGDGKDEGLQVFGDEDDIC